MGVEASPEKQAPLLYRTEPFRSMEPARRFQLLWQSRAVQFGRGESIFAAGEPPKHVLIIFEGQVSVFGELPAEPGPIMLDELGPGGCVGWNAALAAVPGVCAVATSEVNGLMVPAPAFLEITRYDPAIKDAIYSKPLKSEVWRAVLAEMERCTGTVRSARVIVDSMLKQSLVYDWPEDEAKIVEATDYAWVVVGGEGAQHGQRWQGGEGVLWARLIGLPQEKLNEGLMTASAQATVEPEVSPSRNDVHSPKGIEKTGAISSSSEVRRPCPEPSRSLSGRSEDIVIRADWMWGRVLTAFVIVALCTLTGIVWWASRQVVIRTISLPGALTFTGETRPLVASAAGTLVEFNVRAGERVKPGAVLAVVRPPFDEARWANLNETLTEAKREAAFCQSFLKGTPSSATGISPDLTQLAADHGRILGEARVLAAIIRGDSAAPELTRDERHRVEAHLSDVSFARSDRLDTAARDAATRGEDLREAEMSLREAQNEVRMHQQSFAGARSEDKKEAAQEIADYRRVLGVLTREVKRREQDVSRLRREINLLRAEVVPMLAPAAEDRSVELTAAQAGLARIELDFRQREQTARETIRETEAAIERFRADAAPRQILARAPGLVSEASSLAIGAQVEPTTTLAQLVTRETWQIECNIPVATKARLQSGQPIRVAYTTAQRERASAVEPLVLTDEVTPRLLLHVTRDDWRDGMRVQIETDVVIGSLLDEWFDQAPAPL